MEVIDSAGAAVMRVMGETTMDWLNLILAGWGHDAGREIVGDWNRDAGVAVPDVES